MPLGINNPLIKRVRRHRSMSILFRSIDEPSPRPIGRRESKPVQFIPAYAAAGQEVDQPVMAGEPKPTALEEAISQAESVPSAPDIQPTQRKSAPSQKPEISEQRPASIQAQPEPSTGPEPEASQSEARKEEDPWGETWDRLKAIKAFHERRKATEAQAKEQEQEESDREDTAASEQVQTKEQPDRPRKRRVQFEYVESGQPITPMQLDDAPQEEPPSPEPETQTVAGSDAEIQADDDNDPDDTIETAARQAEAPPIAEEISDVGASEKSVSEALQPVQLERPSEPVQKKTKPEVTQESLLPETEDIAPFEEDTEKTEEPQTHTEIESTDEVTEEQDIVPEIEITKPAGSIESAIQKTELPAPQVKKAKRPETTTTEPSEEPTELQEFEKSAIESLESAPEEVVQTKSEPAARLPAAAEQPPATGQPQAASDQPPATIDQPPAAIDQPPATEQPPAAIDQPPATEQPPAAIDQPQAAFDQPPATIDQPQAAFDQPPATIDQPPATIDQPPAVIDQPPAAVDQPPAAVDQIAAAIQRAEEPAPPAVSTPVKPGGKAMQATPPQQDRGLGQRIMDSARRLFRREEPSPKMVQPLPEMAIETALSETPPSPVRTETVQKETIQRAISAAEQPASREPAPREPTRPPEAPTSIQERPVVKATLAQPSTPAETRPSLPEKRPQVELATTPDAAMTHDEVIESADPIPIELQPDKLQPIGLQPLSEPEHFVSPSEAERAKPAVVEQEIQRSELAPSQPAAAPLESKPPTESSSQELDIPQVEEPAIEIPDAAPLDEHAEASELEPEGLEIPEQAVPLEEAWPVHRVAPEVPAPEVEMPPSGPQPSPDERVIQRKTAGGDPSADQVDQALREVAPEVQSDSAIELVTPRRPRPVPRPVQKKAIDKAASEAESMPGKDSQSIQRQHVPDELVDEGDAEQPAQLPATSPLPEMVPTEVGQLPSDFWRLLGEEAPSPKPPSQTVDSGKVKSQVQRDAIDTGLAVSTAERPPLDEAISREWGPAVVQRVESRERTSVSQQAAEAPAEGAAEAGSAIDVEKLAREVYGMLKRKLTIERERSRGRF